MTAVTVRQSGGAEIISIPKAIGSSLGLHVGSKLELTVVDNTIVLTPVDEEISLEELLANSPKECFRVTDEDREWIDARPAGKEI
jgi:AbrB family looped-hinge helix DNA binding protein